MAGTIKIHFDDQGQVTGLDGLLAHEALTLGVLSVALFEARHFYLGKRQNKLIGLDAGLRAVPKNGEGH